MVIGLLLIATRRDALTILGTGLLTLGSNILRPFLESSWTKIFYLATIGGIGLALYSNYHLYGPFVSAATELTVPEWARFSILSLHPVWVLILGIIVGFILSLLAIEQWTKVLESISRKFSFQSGNPWEEVFYYLLVTANLTVSVTGGDEGVFEWIGDDVIRQAYFIPIFVSGILSGYLVNLLDGPEVTWAPFIVAALLIVANLLLINVLLTLRYEFRKQYW
jgi:hypothetical protein